MTNGKKKPQSLEPSQKEKYYQTNSRNFNKEKIKNVSEKSVGDDQNSSVADDSNEQVLGDEDGHENDDSSNSKDSQGEDESEEDGSNEEDEEGREYLRGSESQSEQSDSEGGNNVLYWGPSDWQNSEAMLSAATVIDHRHFDIPEGLITEGLDKIEGSSNGISLDIDLQSWMQPFGNSDLLGGEGAFAFDTHYEFAERPGSLVELENMMPAQGWMDSTATQWIHDTFLLPLIHSEAYNDSFLVGHFNELEPGLLNILLRPCLDHVKLSPLTEYVPKFRNHRYWIIPLIDVNMGVDLEKGKAKVNIEIISGPGSPEVSPTVCLRGRKKADKPGNSHVKNKDKLKRMESEWEILEGWMKTIAEKFKDEKKGNWCAWMPAFDKIYRKKAKDVQLSEDDIRTEYIPMNDLSKAALCHIIDDFRLRAELVDYHKAENRVPRDERGVYTIQISMDAPRGSQNKNELPGNFNTEFSQPLDYKTGSLGTHWWFCIFDMKDGRLYSHDSLVATKTRKSELALVRNLKWFVSTFFPEVPQIPEDEMLVVVKDTPKQKNSWACGYHTWLGILIFMTQGYHKNAQASTSSAGGPSHTSDESSRAAKPILSIQACQKDADIGDSFQRALYGIYRGLKSMDHNFSGSKNRKHRDMKILRQGMFTNVSNLTDGRHRMYLTYAQAALKQAGAILFTFLNPDQDNTLCPPEGKPDLNAHPHCAHGIHIIPVPENTKVILFENPTPQSSVHEAIWDGSLVKEARIYSTWKDQSGDGRLKFLVGNAGKRGSVVRTNFPLLYNNFHPQHAEKHPNATVSGFCVHQQEGTYTIRLPDRAFITLGGVTWCWLKRKDGAEVSNNDPLSTKNSQTTQQPKGNAELPDRNGTGNGILGFLQREGMEVEARIYAGAIQSYMHLIANQHHDMFPEESVYIWSELAAYQKALKASPLTMPSKETEKQVFPQQTLHKNQPLDQPSTDQPLMKAAASLKQKLDLASMDGMLAPEDNDDIRPRRVSPSRTLQKSPSANQIPTNQPLVKPTVSPKQNIDAIPINRNPQTFQLPGDSDTSKTKRKCQSLVSAHKLSLSPQSASIDCGPDGRRAIQNPSSKYSEEDTLPGEISSPQGNLKAAYHELLGKFKQVNKDLRKTQKALDNICKTATEKRNTFTTLQGPNFLASQEKSLATFPESQTRAQQAHGASTHSTTIVPHHRETVNMDMAERYASAVHRQKLLASLYQGGPTACSESAITDSSKAKATPSRETNTESIRVTCTSEVERKLAHEIDALKTELQAKENETNAIRADLQNQVTTLEAYKSKIIAANKEVDRLKALLEVAQRSIQDQHVPDSAMSESEAARTEAERRARETEKEAKERERRLAEAEKAQQELKQRGEALQAEKQQIGTEMVNLHMKLIRDQLRSRCRQERKNLLLDSMRDAQSEEAMDNARKERRNHCAYCGKMLNKNTFLSHFVGGAMGCNLPGYSYLITKETAVKGGWAPGGGFTYRAPKGVKTTITLPKLPDERLQTIRREVREENWNSALDEYANGDWDLEGLDDDSEDESDSSSSRKRKSGSPGMFVPTPKKPKWTSKKKTSRKGKYIV